MRTDITSSITMWERGWGAKAVHSPLDKRLVGPGCGDVLLRRRRS